jgi:transposase
MWEPFITSTMEHVPNAAAKIVFDRFHIMKHMTKAVDDVRKAEHRQLQAAGDDTLKRSGCSRAIPSNSAVILA